VNESDPKKFALGVYVTLAVHVLGTVPVQLTVPIGPRVPFDGPPTIEKVTLFPSASVALSWTDTGVSSFVLAETFDATGA
jgi:hypothetical protein